MGCTGDIFCVRELTSERTIFQGKAEILNFAFKKYELSLTYIQIYEAQSSWKTLVFFLHVMFHFHFVLLYLYPHFMALGIKHGFMHLKCKH